MEWRGYGRVAERWKRYLYNVCRELKRRCWRAGEKEKDNERKIERKRGYKKGDRDLERKRKEGGDREQERKRRIKMER